MKCPHCGVVIDLKDSPDFESWWEIYPRKDAKGQARKAYASALKKISTETLLSRVKLFREITIKKKTERNLIPMGSTWLNGERWGDEELIGGITGVLSAQGLKVHPSWASLQAQLIGIIGLYQFEAWFGGSELKLNTFSPSQIIVTSPLRRDWILKHFRDVLFKLLGKFEIVVKDINKP